MKIVVLAGGYSTERNVSLSSSAQIANALIKKGHEVLVLDVYVGLKDVTSFDEAYKKYSITSYSHSISQNEPDLKELKQSCGNQKEWIGPNVIAICQTADCCFIGLHGSIGENGQLQSLLDIYNICYTGTSYKGSFLAMDKLLSKQLMKAQNILTPEWEEIILGESYLWNKFPCVAKVNEGGSSIGVEIVEDKSQLDTILTRIAGYCSEIFIEEKITGREFSVGILGDKALPAIEIISATGFFDYQSKYQTNGAKEICPAPISKELSKKMQEIAMNVHKRLGLSVYSRIDFIVDSANKIYCIEANTLPGMTPNSLFPQEAQADGIDYADLCEEIIALSLKKQKNE